MKNLWKFFEGKKRNIGIILGFVLKGITIFAPDLLPENQVNFIDNGIDLFLIGGVFDSARRSKQGEKIQNNITQATKKATTTVTNLIKIKK